MCSLNMAEVISDLENGIHNKKTMFCRQSGTALGDKHGRDRGNAMPGYVGGDADVTGIKWIKCSSKPHNMACPEHPP